jgi:hypothetical protein
VSIGKARQVSLPLSRRVAAITITVASQVACHSLADGAKSDFSTTYTCPANRVEVRPRPDLHPSDFKPKARPKTPPSEIAADPERLRMWQAEQDRSRNYDDTYHSIYEASGCGHRALYECGHASRGSSTSWICWERTLPRETATPAQPTEQPTVPPLEPPR